MKNFILTLLFSLPSFSTTIQPIHGKAMENLDAAFPANCYTLQKSLTCQFWARALKLELEELIVSMQNHDPAESEDLHSDMLIVEDSFLQATALSFTRNYSNNEQSYLKRAKEFFFGTDNMAFAHRAADYIYSAGTPEDRSLVNRLRSSHPTKAYHFSFNDLSASIEGNVQDGLLSLTADEWIDAPITLTRIYLDDVLNPDYLNPTSYFLWGVSYVAQEQLQDLISILTKYTGRNPVPSKQDLKAKQKPLEKELEELGKKLQEGDYSVMPRFQEASAELQRIHIQIMWWERITGNSKINSIQLWVIEDPKDPNQILQAYTTKFDSILNKSIVVRYVK